ncbi:hypothetical protein ASC75_02515 [Aminobacter sp. DSM 101952]|uniref:hypothetical protein n=1 Tax=Aminobacter sp. DSM 101952 TaxID=2735891 RepID=UPI0006F2C14F|nr:hypothetical protein [Aminobacter sp. DSM 101952]KQU76505.1 hypothetical protein ASC75_02515 [Aminobacter sp. DSM 101952]
MRILGYVLAGAGVLVCAVTFGLWVWLNSFACGMIPTGCKGFRLRWEDSEALAYFIPPFILGCVIAVAGAATIAVNRKRARKT